MIEYYDTLGGTYRCLNGHERYAVIQGPKFQALMTSGAEALNAGFTLEACNTFSASMERCYEFMLRAMLMKAGLTDDLAQRQFAEMAKQSERQLGAFMINYATLTGDVFIPDKRLIEQRNNFVHKGKVPNATEASLYCEAIYARIRNLVAKLKVHLEREMLAIIARENAETFKQCPAGMQPELISTSGVFYVMDGGYIETLAEGTSRHLSFQQLAKATQVLSPEMREMMRRERISRKAASEFNIEE